ncbi:MAG: cupin domain-containing protein [Motiliproteus sp.]
MKTLYALLAATLLLNTSTLMAADVSAEILAQGSASWDSGGFQYPAGKPQLTVQKISIKAGSEPLELSIHCHTIPLAAYVVSGSVKVVKLSGEEKTFQAGEGLIEVVNSWHKGVFVDDTELIVFYAGAEGTPLSFKQGDTKPTSASCR